jgi:hypothetical protein
MSLAAKISGSIGIAVLAVYACTASSPPAPVGWRVAGQLSDGSRTKFVEIDPEYAKDREKYDEAMNTIPYAAASRNAKASPLSYEATIFPDEHRIFLMSMAGNTIELWLLPGGSGSATLTSICHGTVSGPV